MMHRYGYLLIFLVLWRSVYAQIPPRLVVPPSAGFVWLQQPINPNHPQARGIQNWWRVLPGWVGGPTAGTAGNFTASDFTVTFWVKPHTLNLSGLDGTSVFVYKGGFNTQGWFIGHAQLSATVGQLSFACNQSGTAQEVDSIGGYLAVDTWTFVAVTKAGTTGRIFANGVEVTYQAQPSLTNPISSTQNLQLGRYQDDITSNFFNGAMDDVRLYGRALTPLEIAALYQESRAGDPTLLQRLLPVAVAAPPVGNKSRFFPFFGPMGDRH